MAELTCPVCHDNLPRNLWGYPAKCRRCHPRTGGTGATRAFFRSGILPNLLALVSAAVFYSIGPFLLLRDTYWYHLFCAHGWVPYMMVFLFFVALWVLLLRFPALNRELAAFELELLPSDVDAAIGPAEAQQILQRIGRLKPRQRSLLLTTRIRQALLRLNQLGTAEKLDDLLRYRGEADAVAIESSYAIPRFIIWAIPVLGFVGTVLGISNGVQAFSSLIQNASDLEGLRESLKGVTYGLGQAFETTMVALCMSLGLMLLMSFLQRREDELLARADDYCMENLLHRVRMPSPQSAVDMGELAKALSEFVEMWRESQKAGPPAPAGIRRRDAIPTVAPSAPPLPKQPA